MIEEREVQRERAIEFAKTHHIQKVFETSAKSGENVEEVFSCAGKELFQQTEKEDADNDTDVTAGNPDPRRSFNKAAGGGKQLKNLKPKPGGKINK